MTDWIGRTVSKVEVKSLLGRGGMADVYLGTHTTLNRPVAIKVMQAHLSEDATLLDRFRAEAQSVAGLRHPNIVQVFDYDVFEDCPYMVMEYIQGPTLKDYLRARRNSGASIDARMISRLMDSMASALDYAHARSIIHRDVKPANILLRRDHGDVNLNEPLPDTVEPVLTDFGVARITNASTQTASGVIIGTPSYMSPEQVRGDPVDPRSDIYSLGIILYELLTGKLPFDSETQASVLMQHLNSPPPPLPADREDLQPIIDHALAKDPQNRFQKASDLASSLSRELNISEDASATEPVMQRSFTPVSTTSSTQAGIPGITNTKTALPSSTGIFQPDGGLNPLWIVGGIGLLGVIVGAMALGILLFGGVPKTQTPSLTQPLTTQAQSGTSGPSLKGGVFVSDTSLTVSLSGLDAPPAGSAYEAWLTSAEGDPLSLGILAVSDGNASLKFTAPQGQNLLVDYDAFAISLEPAPDDNPGMSDHIAYSGSIDPQSLAQARLMFLLVRDLSLQQGILDGITHQAGVYNAHIDKAINAINSNELPGAKSHSEHTINIIVGQADPAFLDYDGNGRVENPGDGVGLATYLQLLKAAVSTSSDLLGQPSEAASSVIDQAGQLLLTISSAKNDALSITAADSTGEIAGLVPDLESFKLGDPVAALVNQAGGLAFGLTIEIKPAQ
jgi:serine/threonine protein kinase